MFTMTHTNMPARLVLKFRRIDLVDQVTLLDDGNIIVYKSDQGVIRAARNRCIHQGGRFASPDGCFLTCRNHGWRLDASDMRYVNPAGQLRLPELLVEETESGDVSLLESVDPQPWETDRREPRALEPSEFTIRFYAHACMEVSMGDRRLFTDPWLVGPAFVKGWWLIHKPPEDWLERISSADAIYISHNHSDHLNSWTLKKVAEANPNVPVYVPQFDTDACRIMVQRAGLQNIIAVPFGSWVELDEHARFMILQDAAGRTDSGILIEYKGHKLLDIVDCQNLNGGVLPRPIDTLLSSFAGGSSGFPVCWSDLYAESEIERAIERKLDSLRNRILLSAQTTAARSVVPFAGYFSEDHPADASIKKRNRKNSPGEIAALLERVYPEVMTWVPSPGATLDVGLQTPESEPAQSDGPDEQYEYYDAAVHAAASFEPLRSMSGIKRYFDWAGFRGDLVLHVCETDDDFTYVAREFFVDFADMTFPAQRPTKPHRYLRIRVRSDAFRYVLRYGLPWEEFSIGFQARFFREPDVYNFDFWDHFQNHLPSYMSIWN
jgi:CMP-N-acetylneuraminate monooxygenase